MNIKENDIVLYGDIPFRVLEIKSVVSEYSPLPRLIDIATVEFLIGEERGKKAFFRTSLLTKITLEFYQETKQKCKNLIQNLEEVMAILHHDTRN